MICATFSFHLCGYPQYAISQQGGKTLFNLVKIRPMIYWNSFYAHFGQCDPLESDMRRVTL
ncbi:hypothetical protein MARINOS108_20058 [Marinoscillum sp. 108]|nr:hypothetical protein MARINOS108_20058 [Marinoscillum sp. 108]